MHPIMWALANSLIVPCFVDRINAQYAALKTPIATLLSIESSLRVMIQILFVGYLPDFCVGIC